MSKRISVQWRITILTALLIAAACVSLNLLLFYSGSDSMDALNGFVVEYKTGNQQEMTIEIPQENMQAFFSGFSQQVSAEKVRFERMGWCITALVTLLSAVIAYFVSGRALKPLGDFARQTGQINEESLTDTRLSEDTTAEFRQLSRSVNAMLDRLAQSFDTQRQFTGNAAHELRTPLTAINGWAETVAGDLGDPELAASGLSIIQKETRRLSQMVEELLDFSRIESGRLKLQTEVFDLRGELYDALFTYTELLRQEGMASSYEEPEEPIMINGDRDRLKQVFLNIIDNAAKYGKDGKKIAVSAVQENGMAVVRIQDYGMGIPKDELPFVKEKFFKGSAKGRGAGIGLAVCTEIVELHEGTIDIESEYGEGTCVIITLPLYRPEG